MDIFTDNISKRTKKARELNNMIVMTHFKNGFSHALVPPEATHFPPRPIIKKDKDALEFVHKIPKLILIDQCSNSSETQDCLK